MIISKTPLRIPFFSGSTDLPAFYEKEMGAAISTTINKYVYVSVHKHEDDKIIINGVLYKNFDDIPSITVRECLRRFGNWTNKKGITISTSCDINHKGTGLGMSSAYTVGLLNALAAQIWRDVLPPRKLAEMACDIEMNKCKFNMGKQDQYAAAFGGLNMFYFHITGNVSVTKLQVPYNLKNHCHLYNTGIERQSSDTIIKKIDMDSMREGRDYAYRMFDLIENGPLYELGTLLNDSWKNKKKQNPNASTTIIDTIYDKIIGKSLTSSRAKEYQAGMKVVGAGGGGFLLFYIPDDFTYDFTGEIRNFKEVKLEHMPFEFTTEGSKIVYSDK